jgi:glycosyltransferase involved in cell wall biosynthesis
MKILLVSPHYPPRFMGGVEVYTQRVAHALAARNHTVLVVAVDAIDGKSANGIGVQTTLDAGVEVSRLSLPAAHGFRETFHRVDVEQWLLDYLDRHRPDIVHLQSGYLVGDAVLAAARAVATPLAVTLHDFWFVCPRITLQHPDGRCCTGPDTPEKCAGCLATEQRRYRLPFQLLGPRSSGALTALLTRLPRSWSAIPDLTADVASRRSRLLAGLATADAIFSPSQFVRQQLIDAGFDGARIEVVRLGVEPMRRVPRRVIADGDVRLRIGFLGQIAPHKGVHVLVEAMRHCQERRVELVIHGRFDRDAAYAARLRLLAGGDPRIVLAGPLERSQVADYLASIDVLAVPSLWYENSPLVILEARAAGRPVLASRLGALVEQVADERDGLLAEPGNPRAFAAQIDRLARTPELFDRLASAIRPPATVDEEVDTLCRVYARLVRTPLDRRHAEPLAPPS